MKNNAPFAVVPIDVLRDRRLGINHLRVLITLLSFMTTEKPKCFPRRETIRARCGVDVEKISTCTSQLVDFGWLIKTGNGGRSRSNLYEFVIPAEFRSSVNTITDTETVSQSTAQTMAISVRGKKETIERNKNRDNSAELSFRRFWASYPRKCSRNSALVAWHELNPSPELIEKILAYINNASRNNPHWQSADRKFIPYPARFIREQRWEDEITSTTLLTQSRSINEKNRKPSFHAEKLNSILNDILNANDNINAESQRLKNNSNDL